jgi:DNA-binding phage protein
MTQAQVCLATGVGRKQLQAMEADSNPRLDDLLVVVAYIGIPLGEAIRHPQRDTPWVARRH